jgi:hypothetical protein
MKPGMGIPVFPTNPPLIYANPSVPTAEKVYTAGSAFGGTDQKTEDPFAPPGASRATTGGTGGASIIVLGGN